MITALDTNVPSALWSGQSFAASVAASLARAGQEGGLVISGVVYAELLAYPGATGEFVERFLQDTRIVVEFDFSREVWLAAGERFAVYCRRRRRSGGSESKRLLADFLVGAHALLRADRLFTLDPARYRRDFPELRLL
jgi:predicted nucleic acid-binding protein